MESSPSNQTPASHASSGDDNQSQPIEKLVWRALRLKCPACGRGPIFRGWFSMNENCPACGRSFNRSPGYLLGSIYFNYGITASIIVVAFFALFFGDVLTDNQRLLVLAVFGIIFPTWFFRYARALWIAFDERWDPWPNDEEARQMRIGPESLK